MAQRPGAVSAEIDERDVLLAIRLHLPQVGARYGARRAVDVT